ncbi:MAG: hypothetical protein WA208_07165 [Thermoanaerobaculia bacterium]
MTERLKELARAALAAFVADHLPSLTEDETLAVIANPFVTPAILSAVANQPRLTAFYSVRLALVAHRQTPQAHAVKLVHYLFWNDLLRLSVDVRVPAPARRAIDGQLLARVGKLTLGEKIASARRCGGALIQHFLFEPDARVLAALLVNRRLREDDVLHLISSRDVSAEKLQMLADDEKWSFRYQVRKALVLNRSTPRAAAATQLRHLTPNDLRQIHSNPATSTYIRRCIERTGVLQSGSGGRGIAS